MRINKWVSGFFFGIFLGAPLFARADFYVANGDTIALVGQSGSVINGNFISVDGATGLAFGADGNLFIGSPIFSFTDGAGIGVFNPTTGAALGTFTDHFSDNDLNNPQGLAFHNGNLYVADGTAGSIFVYNSSGSHLSTLSDISMGTPYGLTFSSSGTLYIADIGQGNVLSYNGSSFAQVNSQPGIFNSGLRDVGVGHDGNLYVLDSSGIGGIYKLSLTDGSAQKIVDYSTSLFFASNLIVGSDGQLYVTGQEDGENEILRYGTDGSGGNVFADLGFGGGGPSYIVESVPEPNSLMLGLMGAGLAGITWLRRKSRAA